MKVFQILLFWCLALKGVMSISYLRPKNDKGPGIRCLKCLNLTMVLTTTFLHYEAAMRAGVDCIEHVERYFFKNVESQQVQVS